MREIVEFLKSLKFENDEQTRETLIKATTYYAYIIQEYANARSIRKIKEAEEHLKIKEENNGEKLTQKDKEAMVVARIKSEIETEYTLEALVDALQQVMTTARKLLELSITEKNYSQF